MRTFFAIQIYIALAVTASAAPAAKIDFTNLNNGVAAYSAALDNFLKTSPGIQTPQDAAKAISSLADANTKFAAAIVAFPAEHPEAVKLQNPPPEFSALAAKMIQLRTTFSSMAQAMTAMRQRFGTDPQFALAIVSLDKSADLMRNCQPSQGLQLAGNIFRELSTVDNAIDTWAIEKNKKMGELPTPSDIAAYFKPGGRLRQSAERGTLSDSLGNPITINPLGIPPSVSQQSVMSLSNVVNLDFWQPFVAKTAALSKR